MNNLSASKVDCFHGCRRLFKYRYLEPPYGPPPNKYFAIGNIAHKALELFHSAMLPNSTWIDLPLPLYKLMSDSFREAVRRISYNVLKKSDLFDIRDMLRDYLKFLGKQDMPDVVCTEKKFTITVDGIVIKGVVDRVDNGVGELVTENGIVEWVTIVDYKTGRPLRDKHIKESVQLPTYAMWASQHFPNMAIQGQYTFLTALGKRNGIKKFTISDDMIEDAMIKYRAVHIALEDGCEFRRNSQYQYCGNCDFRRYCFQDKNNGLKEKS